MQRMPSTTWVDSGSEDAKSGPIGQRVNHQLQRVPRTVSFTDSAHPMYTHTGDSTYFAWLEHLKPSLSFISMWILARNLSSWYWIGTLPSHTTLQNCKSHRYLASLRERVGSISHSGHVACFYFNLYLNAQQNNTSSIEGGMLFGCSGCKDSVHDS